MNSCNTFLSKFNLIVNSKLLLFICRAKAALFRSVEAAQTFTVFEEENGSQSELDTDQEERKKKKNKKEKVGFRDGKV